MENRLGPAWEMRASILSSPEVSFRTNRYERPFVLGLSLMVNASHGFLTRICSTSPSVKPASLRAGTNFVNKVSNGRKLPPPGSPTAYQPASCETSTLLRTPRSFIAFTIPAQAAIVSEPTLSISIHAPAFEGRHRRRLKMYSYLMFGVIPLSRSAFRRSPNVSRTLLTWTSSQPSEPSLFN